MDIVTSYYKDLTKLNDWPLELIKNKNMNLILYKKDDDLSEKEQNVLSNNHIAIANIGMCDYAFLYHIVKNYHNLPDRTVFTKITWKHDNFNFEKFLNNCIEYDYCGCANENQIESYVICDNTCLNEAHALNTKYRKNIINLDVPKNHETRSIKFAETLEDWYLHIFGKQNLLQIIDVPINGPCFSVSKKAILANTLESYEYLLNRFYRSSNSWNYEKCNFCYENGKKVLADSNGMAGHYYYSNRKLDELTDIYFHFHDNFLRFYKILFVKNNFLVGNIN